MPYKDPQKRKAAKHRSYLKNRDAIAAKHKANRPARNAWTSKRREELNVWLIDLKSSPCIDCNVSYPYYVMDFDHVRGEKIASVRELAHFCYSRKAIQEEVDKCDLVCANCHRIRTAHRGGYP